MDWFRDKTLRADGLLFYACMGAFFAMPLGTAPMNIFGIIAVCIWLFSGKAFRQLQVLIHHSWFWPVLLLIILPWIGLLYSPDETGLGLKYAKKSHYWLYGLVVASIAFNKFKTEQLIQAFIGGLAVNSVAAMVQLALVLLHGKTLTNDLGLGPGYSTLSVYLIVGILVIAFYFNQTQKNRDRLYLCLLMGLFFVHLIMMKGRNGYFTFIVVSPLIIVHMMKRANPLKILVVYGLLAVLMALSPSVRDQVSFTMRQVKSHIEAPPEAAWGKDYIAAEERFWITANAIRVFKQHPVFGVGTGGFLTAVQQGGKPDWPLLKHPHNNFLYMAVSYGIIGVLTLTWFFWEIFKNSWPLRRTVTGYFIFSSALVLFVSGLLNCQIINAGTGFLFAVTTGLQEEFPRFSSRILHNGTINYSEK